MTQTQTQRRLVRTAAGFTRKAIEYNQPERVSADDLARMFIIADGRCYYCRADLDPFTCTFDHKTPFERGGSNSIENIAVSCLTDNRQKYTMTEAEYLDWLALERNCRSCGIAFKPRAADYRRGFGWYDSRRCSGKAGGLA